MAETTHDRFADAPALYAIGALPAEERAAFEAHLSECPICAAEWRALAPVAGALPLALPDVDPPAALRERVLGAALGRPTGRSAAGAPRRGGDRAVGSDLRWLAAAALLVLAAGLGLFAWSARARLDTVESQLRDAQARLAVLTASDLTQVNLAGQPPAPNASARAFLSRSQGVVFAASNLPALPAGRTYQLWYLTTGTPVSAGLFKPDAAGGAVLTLTPPAATTSPTGLAVSIEPDGGVPAPTGAIYLAGTAH